MSSENIEFFVNNRKIGSTILVGPQPDLSLFQQNKDFFVGECNIVFQVGNQKVSNKVTLDKTTYRVENNFIPFNIQGYIEDEKIRIRAEQDNAKFTDELTEVYFIPAKTLLSCTQTFPDFNRSNLVKDPDGEKFFVSHPWLTIEHPDPKGKHLSLLQDHARRNPNAYYWIDFSCLPQTPRSAMDEDFFRKSLPKIASIQSKSSTIAITEADYSGRMWCYLEHFTGVLFSQIHNNGLSGIEYIGTSILDNSMVDKVQTLEEPIWNNLKVTRPADIPSIKYNYKLLSNFVKFQLFDRFVELLKTIPGNEIYSGYHYPQSSFGIDYTASLQKLRKLFFDFGGDIQFFYKENSFIWLARRFSWSIYPDDYKMEEFKFSPYLFHSEDLVGLIALLLGIIKIVNKDNDKLIELRELYARIILMSLYS